jgi:hypothetical protein
MEVSMAVVFRDLRNDGSPGVTVVNFGAMLKV